jgi:phytanoyl-CoA hydroxylase
MVIDAQSVRQDLDEIGWAIVPGFLAEESVAAIRDALDPLADEAAGGNAPQTRLLKPHLHHPSVWTVLSDPLLATALTQILDHEPVCIQSMYYFKPPGSKGLGLHRDQQYIAVEPGDTLAVWIAVDPAAMENGCLLAVPGSHTQEIEQSPGQQSPFEDGQRVYTDIHMRVPEGMEAQPIEVEPGDMVLFGGHLIHGSLPNRSTTKGRRSLVSHYVRRDTRAVSRRHHPVMAMDGTVITDIQKIEDPTYTSG